MGYKITEIEGIGAKMAAKLETAGIKTTDHLLKHTATPTARKKLAEGCGISPKWANMADMMRVSGIGEEYSELLEAANCNTVKQLARRNATSLTKKMAEINEAKKLVRSVPTEANVKKWIEKAAKLEPILTY